ncbi:hypothetical protein GCM10015535_29390 [Streptomyces gelaticus]|uniref:Uncharacterized protein n=1 Tax=Streptomyces gelaticus TaxID=285446 RepID=A0ABQ2VZV7_9ACTN|nr:hypothetical protein [Streptomyces gelaticus]GGV84499.1 hypothetical protein GCM10015535_29390 [Streptomyces gelaticus]
MSSGRRTGPPSWLKGKHALSWQIVHRGLDEALFDPDPAEVGPRAMKAMTGMRRPDPQALRSA